MEESHKSSESVGSRSCPARINSPASCSTRRSRRGGTTSPRPFSDASGNSERESNSLVEVDAASESGIEDDYNQRESS